MSSSAVRTLVKDYLSSTFPTETLIDLTGEYDTIDDLINDYSLGRQDDWVGLQFLPSDESPMTIDSDNDAGNYREEGTIYIHVVSPSRLGVGDAILTRAESIRNALRGKRLSGMVIERVIPPNFESGATLDFEGGYTSATVVLDYHYDLKYN